MPTASNSFGSGLNQDTSKSKNNPSNYYYLLNGKVVTETGLSTGSITNETGNALKFKIPDTAPVYEILVPEDYSGTSQLLITTSSGSTVVPLLQDELAEVFLEITTNTTVAASILALDYNVFLNGGRIVIVGLDDLISVTLTSGDLTLANVVTALTDLKICGWGTLETKIVVLTTDNDEDEPVGQGGQIWEIEFDESTDTINGLVNGFLVPSVHLKYNNKLNLSLANRVGEVIGRYENSKIRSIYFTDFYNNLRAFNLANPEGLALSPSDLDVRADLTLSQPIIKSIGNGTIPIGSVVQYCYRLKTINGSTSIISQLSPPTPLADNPLGGDYEDFKGSGFNIGDHRSVTYSIDNIDTSFTLIEHIVVLYENLDVPQIYIFKEELIPLNGRLTVTHSGSEDYLELTQQEFNLLNLSFVCKSITSKRNKLIAANIIYEKVLLDFDARAYRFNGSQVCTLYNKQGGIEYPAITSSNWATVSSTADAINPYNDESGTVYNTIPTNTPVTWETDFQFKYQSDGATYGGEGINVKYNFISTDTVGFGNAPTGTAPHVKAGRNTNNILLPDGTTITNSSYFGDFKSPLLSTYMKGYKRGEVYRFGIVFYDKKGNPSLVNWIGDIRFPEASEFIGLGSSTDVTSGLSVKQLGIQFHINVASIQTEIEGYSIVRLERKENDKTKLGTGIPVGLTNNSNDSHTSLVNIFNGNYTEDIDISTLGSSEQGAVYILQDYPGETAYGNIFTTLFPFHQYGFEYSFKTGDYLKEVGHYVTSPYANYYNNNGDNTIAVQYQGYEFASLSTYRRFLIDKVGTLPYRGYQAASDYVTGDINIISNTSFSRDDAPAKYTPLGLGNTKLITSLDTTPPTGFANNLSTGWNNGIFQGGNVGLSVGSTFGSGDFEMKLLDYCRFLTSQYGGASYESRASQTYIPTGHYQPIDNTSASLNSSNVYGGDIFVVYCTDEYITMHWETGGNNLPFNEEHTNNKLSVAVGFPCETDINFNLRHGYTFSDNQDFSGTWTQTPYSYNQVYSQNSNVIQQYISPAILDTSTDEHPHAILISEEKIDGEAFDAWKIFATNNFLEVDGVHGDINKIITFNDKVIFYQTRAIGQVSVQDRSITQDTSGTEVVLGTGAILDFYSYISTNYGCFHQFSVVMTPNAVYNVDTISKKIIQISQSASAISDVKGLSAFFAEELTGIIREEDQTLYMNNFAIAGNPAIGIHGVYDQRNSRVIWTVLKGETVSIINREGLGVLTWVPDNFTITFNEMMGSFESFKSFTPKLYLQANGRLLSTDPENMEQGYLHNVGNRGEFYGTTYDTKITVLINTAPDVVKTLDVIEYLMDLFDTNGIDIPLETFNSLRIYNSHQDTGTVILTPQNNIMRTLRKWRMNVLRDNANNKPRLRDYHFFLELTYNNNNNKELVLHDITHHIRLSNF